MAQTTANFNGTLTLTDQPVEDRFFTYFFGTGQVGTLGTALRSMSRNQQLADDRKSGVGQSGGGPFPLIGWIPSPSPRGNTGSFAALHYATGRINTGTGAYANISNTAPSGPTANVTLIRTSTSPLGYTLSVTGNAVLGGQTISLAITNVPFILSNNRVNVFRNSTGTGTLNPSATVQISANTTPGGGTTFHSAQFIEIVVTMTLSQTDSMQALLHSHVRNAPTEPAVHDHRRHRSLCRRLRIGDAEFSHRDLGSR